MEPVIYAAPSVGLGSALAQHPVPDMYRVVRLKTMVPVCT